MNQRQNVVALKPPVRPVRVGAVLANRAAGFTARAVAHWHALLCAVAALNALIWGLSAGWVLRADAQSPGWTASHWQLLLSAGYVFGCAFRSILPVYDIPRVVVVDSRLSSIVIGRSVATVAELCFAAQWALLLHGMAVSGDSQLVRFVSLMIVPLVLVAELCSWFAVLTTEQRAHALENSIWGLAAAIVVGSLLVIEPHRIGGLYVPFMTWCVGGAAYVAYLFLFDVPLYWSRWRADRASGRRPLPVAQGLIDTCRSRYVCHRWEVWKSEVLWMSLYFTFGVWCSVSLVYASVSPGAHTL